MRARHPVAAKGDRPSCWVCVALLMVISLSADIFGFGHHHSSDEVSGGHHCALCHVQQTGMEPDPGGPAVPVAAPTGRAHIHEPRHTPSLAPGLSPPLRGPPIS